jgi:hypothetical protein
MCDWIDDLKKQDAEQQEASANSNAMRLHDAGVVRAKAPDLWTLLIAQIDADFKELREAFPNDLSRQGDLNLAGSCINISQALKQEFVDRPTLMPLKPIDFVVTKDEDVVFFWKDWTYTDPTELAEKFVKLVCRIYQR